MSYSHVAESPDENELDIPGERPDSTPILLKDMDTPQNRIEDRLLSMVVTLLPIVGTAVAIYLHVIGWYSIGYIEVGLMFLMQAIAVTGIELGFHRLFAHNSYTPKRWLKIALAGMGSMAFQGPVIWWAAIHRRHHVFSDRPNDPHSMYIMPDGRKQYNKGFWQMFRGFIHAHVGWTWVPDSVRPPGWGRYVRDLYRDPDLFKIHVNYFYFLAAGFVIPGLIAAVYYGSFKGFILGALWGGLVRIFVMNHLTYWTINTVSHSIGARPYETADYSTNSIPILFALPTFGQSYHNNHHAFPYSAVMSHRWYEFDIGAYVLYALRALGQVSDMRIPTQDKLKQKLRKPAA